MRLLLRMGFWLTVVLVLLPSGGTQPTPAVGMSGIEAMSAAPATVGDMRSFCERQPDACTIWSRTATVIGQRVRAGAKMVSEYLAAHSAPADTGAPGNAATGKVPLPTPRPSQHTLLPADLAPTW